MCRSGERANDLRHSNTRLDILGWSVMPTFVQTVPVDNLCTRRYIAGVPRRYGKSVGFVTVFSEFKPQVQVGVPADGSLISANSHTSFGRRACRSLFLRLAPFHNDLRLDKPPVQGHRPLFRRNLQSVRRNGQPPGGSSLVALILTCENIRIRTSSSSTLY